MSRRLYPLAIQASIIAAYGIAFAVAYLFTH